MTMTDHLRDRLAAELAVCKGAWDGPWSFSLNDRDQITLSTHGRTPFNLIEDDKNQAPIEEFEFIARARTGYPLALRALQAVMGLHKPVPYGTENPAVCYHCVDFDNGAVLYPCPTIQAIQEVYGDE